MRATLINYLQTEIYKLNGRVVLIIIALFSGLPFVITEAFIVIKGASMVSRGITLELMQENALGAWTSLLYPLLCMLLVQVIASPEQETNSLNYYKSTQISWLKFYWAKVGLAFSLVTLTGVLNLLFGGLLALTFQLMIPSTGSLWEPVCHLLSPYAEASLYCIPLISFHLWLSLSISKAYLCFALGLVILIVGIPLVNLTDFIYNPYLLLVAARKHGGLNSSLMGFSGLLVASSALLFHYRQRSLS